ncbi:MAG: hypothetical protein DMD35_10095 [Gemmatimonadetes bacterium]|nr:MAG: hypothetical protein DMD35_10095 [Gemmatimonadota bacterium]
MYALGALTYEMLAGEPFADTLADTRVAHTTRSSLDVRTPQSIAGPRPCRTLPRDAPSLSARSGFPASPR